MKKLTMICSALFVFCLAARAQLVLNAGDTWTYQFNSLPQTGFVPAFGTNPLGSLSFVVNSSSFQAGDSLAYEMFENNSSETPIFSGLMESAPPFIRSGQRDFAWQDLQGEIRFRMVSGSATIDSITLAAVVPGPSLSSYSVYSSTFTPVPEPGTPALLVVGVALWIFGGFRKKAPALGTTITCNSMLKLFCEMFSRERSF